MMMMAMKRRRRRRRNVNWHLHRKANLHLHRSQNSGLRDILPCRICKVALPGVRGSTFINLADSQAISRFNSERTPVERERPLSPATIRRRNIIPTIKTPRSYTVEAICAIAHPEPTHALAASRCMTHLLTGSKDGYIRDYDVFPAVNGKTFLTAPQRQHCSVVEGTMKSGLLRYWWENPATFNDLVEENSRSQVCSLLIHSDALWALAGSEVFPSFEESICTGLWLRGFPDSTGM